MTGRRLYLHRRRHVQAETTQGKEEQEKGQGQGQGTGRGRRGRGGAGIDGRSAKGKGQAGLGRVQEARLRRHGEPDVLELYWSFVADKQACLEQIGDLPTRFKYQKAAPQDYGLTPAEILLATDAELNQFLGMKHYAPYRHGSGVGAAGRGMRDRLKELKAKLAKRKWGEVPEDEEATGGRSRDQGWGQNKGGQGSSAGPAKKRKGKKERQKQAAAAGANADGGAAQAAGPSAGTKRKNADDDRGEGSSKRQRA